MLPNAGSHCTETETETENEIEILGRLCPIVHYIPHTKCISDESADRRTSMI